MNSFKELVGKHEIFRGSDFKMSNEMEYNRCNHELYRETRKIEELEYTKNETLIYEQKKLINKINQKIVQIEISNCQYIAEKLEDVGIKFLNCEINAYYYTHLPKYQNQIRVHRLGCPKLDLEFNNKRILGDYFLEPYQSKASFQELEKVLRAKDLYFEDGKYYCGNCLCHVSIQSALLEFEKLKIILEIKLNELKEDLLSTEAKLKSILNAKEKLIKSSIIHKKLPVITNGQSVAVEKIKNAILTDWIGKNPPLEMRVSTRAHFGGVQIGDDRLFVGVGFETMRGEDLCIVYENWHLIDVHGNEIPFLEMSDEERCFAESKLTCGPGSAIPIRF